MLAPKIWSLQIRALHWLIAVSVVINLYFLEEGDPPHRYVGYAAAAFVGIRLLLGLRVKDAAHFSSFPIRKMEIVEFLRSKIRRQSKDYNGHNPLASLVYLSFWFTIVMLGISGFLMGTDYFWGDETLEVIHTYLSYFLQFLIASHFLGMILDSVEFKRPSWMAMINGEKPKSNRSG